MDNHDLKTDGDDLESGMSPTQQGGDEAVEKAPRTPEWSSTIGYGTVDRTITHESNNGASEEGSEIADGQGGIPKKFIKIALLASATGAAALTIFKGGFDPRWARCNDGNLGQPGTGCWDDVINPPRRTPHGTTALSQSSPDEVLNLRRQPEGLTVSSVPSHSNTGSSTGVDPSNRADGYTAPAGTDSISVTLSQPWTSVSRPTTLMTSTVTTPDIAALADPRD